MADRDGFQGWYYVSENVQSGPVERVEIDRLIAKGQIGGGTLVWRVGLDDWEPASEHFAVTKSSLPPPIPASPPPYRKTELQSATSVTSPDQRNIYVGAPSRGFGEAIGTCLAMYATFSGRASRSEYWYIFLFVSLVNIICAILNVPFSSDNESVVGAFLTIPGLVLLLPNLAVTCRRLHDTDRSGWWIGGFWLAMPLYAVILAVIMGAGTTTGDSDAVAIVGVIFGFGMLAYLIAMLIFLCQRGVVGPNRHG